MTRVLHIFGRMNRGGAELRTLDVMRRLKPEDPKMEFVALSGLPGDLDDQIRNMGGEVHYCKLDLGFPRRFKRLLRERKIDVVHSHVQLASGYILRCAGMAGIAGRIAHFRSCDSGRPITIRRWLQYKLMRHWLARWATLIVGNSEASLSHGWRSDWMTDRRCVVIHNGLDISAIKTQTGDTNVRGEFGWSERTPIAIHVGRLDEAKNHDRLIEIWAEMAIADPNWRFLSAGRIEPTLLQRLKSKCATLGLSDRVVWAGERTDVPRLLLSADIMIFPSIREGLPGAVLEATASGVRVIGSDIPPLLEMTRHLNNIECLSLSSPNSTWTTLALNTARPTRASRAVAMCEYEKSVYQIDRCVDAHKLAWTAGAAGAFLQLNDRTSISNSLEVA